MKIGENQQSTQVQQPRRVETRRPQEPEPPQREAAERTQELGETQKTVGKNLDVKA